MKRSVGRPPDAPLRRPRPVRAGGCHGDASTIVPALVHEVPRLMFLVGPSGVGKSTIAEPLCSDLALYHVDVDRNPLKAYGIKDEWHEFWTGNNPGPIADALRAIAAAEGRAGALLSLPSNEKRVLHPGHVDTAQRAGIEVVVLWGPEGLCKKARKGRDLELGLPWNESKYDERNRRTFELYIGPEYDGLRVEAFEEDGRRRPREETVAAIRALVEA
jgi:hypothetical protein